MRICAILGGLVIASGFAAQQAGAATVYTNSDQVNVLRKYNLPALTFATTASEPGTINGAGSHNGNFGNDPMVLTYDLGAVRAIGSFKMEHSGSRFGESYLIETSTTGFGSMVVGASGTTASDVTSAANTGPQGVRYIRYTGTDSEVPPSANIQVMNEFYAFAPAGQTIDVREGYDLLQDAALITGSTSDGLNGGSTPDVYDDDQQSHVKAQTANGTITISLNDSYRLGAAHLGFFNGQTFADGFKIWTSNAAVLPNQLNDSLWTEVYSFGVGSAGTDIFTPFTSVQPAQHVRLTWNTTFGALTDFEVFAVPEPTSMVFLALGATLLASRRRTAR